MEGGYCSDTQYEEKLEEKEAQHTALEAALKEYGYDVTVLPSFLVYLVQFTRQQNALGQLGIEHGPANKLMRKLHEHAIITLGKFVRSRRALEGNRTEGHKRNRDSH